jgi:hypothetical protein
LAGWTVGEQHISVNEPGGRIACRFQHVTRISSWADASGRGSALPRARRRSSPSATARRHGRRRRVVDEARLYQLVRQQGTIADRRLEIEFLDRGVELYSFTFG